MTALHRTTTRLELTIPAGESSSNIGSLGFCAGGILYMPDTWDAADIGFLVSATGLSGYKPLTREGELVTAVVDSANHTVFPEAGFPIVDFKLFSHNAGTPVVQTAEAVLVIIAKS